MDIKYYLSKVTSPKGSALAASILTGVGGIGLLVSKLTGAEFYESLLGNKIGNIADYVVPTLLCIDSGLMALTYSSYRNAERFSKEFKKNSSD